MAMPGEWKEAAFACLFREHYGRILGVARRIVGNHPEAEEICAETFWRLYRSGAQITSTRRVYGWLYRTATRAAIDVLRARQRKPQEQITGMLDPEDNGESPLDSLLRREQIDRVRGMLAQLDVEKAQILLLRHEGMSYMEVAEIMCVRPGSVGTMLARAEEAFCKVYRRQVTGNERTPDMLVAKEER
jgi:RNA polymerase sigma-70 factor (ECF subfamily)